MKVLLNYCSQSRPYADSRGHVVVELEKNETIDDVREKYKNTDSWWGTKYSNFRLEKSFRDKGKTYEGNLVVVDTRSEYTG